METSDALFGGMLWGSNAVRFIFMDEAGTEAPAPVTVVVGIIVHADKQLLMAERAVDEVVRGIPSEVRETIGPLSAKVVWSNRAIRDRWGQASRLAYLHGLMSLPRRLGLPIAMAMVRRGSMDEHSRGLKKMRPHQFEHFTAFANCVAHADKYLRDKAEPDEVATVVAEQAAEMTAHLKEAARLFRENPLTLPPGAMAWTAAEVAAGHMKQVPDYRVERVRPTIHFVEKEDEKLMLLADACAFGFRRFFNGEEFGSDFQRSILGQDLIMSDWRGNISSTVRAWPNSV